jgi:hypothetical protein
MLRIRIWDPVSFDPGSRILDGIPEPQHRITYRLICTADQYENAIQWVRKKKGDTWNWNEGQPRHADSSKGFENLVAEALVNMF